MLRSKPLISVVVIAFNMTRELPRTLFSLSPAYQQLLGDTADYEILVVDNGSTPPFDPALIPPGQVFRHFYMQDASSSPASALNFGASRAQGSILGFMVDGARLSTPGLIRQVEQAFRAFSNPVLSVPGWHLGSEPQQTAIAKGYNHATEDALLERADWREDGYRLFDIAVPALSCSDVCIAPMAESNALFLRREAFERLHGFDERFDMPGGGLVNLDFYRRTLEMDGSELVMLPGEGSFHQVHGGISTNITRAVLSERLASWHEQYRRITGRPYERVSREPILFGKVTSKALRYLEFSARRAAEIAEGASN